MLKPESAIKDWWSIVRPGGFLIIIVPDEDLYEQKYWPSIFNSDHKFTFTLNNKSSWSPVSINVIKLIKALPKLKLISAEIPDANYNYKYLSDGKPFDKEVYVKINKFRSYISRLPIFGYMISYYLDMVFFKIFKIPIDQTRYKALAQIQVIARKLE
jgi:hypothetical protein